MAETEVDLLAIDRGSVTAPAGCGKTHLIAQALVRHDGPKPILILTHTNAGVVALRGRLDRAGVPSRAYRLSTIDGWAMRLISMFPERSGHDPAILNLEAKTDYPSIRTAAAQLLKAGHVNDVLAASFSRLIVDEYQDCNFVQHAIVWFAAKVLPTAVLGDPMQAIFTFGGKMPDWDQEVCVRFPIAGALTTPWRWRNAGTEDFGAWLLDARQRLLRGDPVDLRAAPPHVTWVHLDGTEDHQRRLGAGRTPSPTAQGSVLIIGDSTKPQGQRDFAGQTPGAITVESVDLKDLVTFAKGLDLASADVLAHVVNFAGSVMTNVGSNAFLQRVKSLQGGTARNPATDAETTALAFAAAPSLRGAVDLLVEIGKQGGVRSHRPGVLQACIKTLRSCDGADAATLYEAAVKVREQNRLLGRPLPKRAVGSTLLLKGLEAEVAVILNAADLDAKNLYVAMTRGSHALVICSPTAVLQR
ncbi:MAG: UvrD-helicase domain-containing protein [Caulobacter sp.]|nr:UvrD-helicase domain-containing protein [Caulobacter sp.]